MSKVMAARGAVCAEHPHHVPVDHCDQCGRRFCGDCLVRGRPQLLCRACWDEAPEREARAARRRHPLHGRLDALRENRASVAAAAVIATVLVLMAVTGAAQVLSPAYREQMGVAVAAVRRAASSAPPAGGTPSAVPTRMVNLVQPEIMGVMRFEAAAGTDPRPLTDGLVGPSAPVWRSQHGFTAADLLMPVRREFRINRVLFAHAEAAPPETWARDVDVSVSLTRDFAEPFVLGRWTLRQTAASQEFRVAPAQVSSVRLRILSNHGSAEYTSLAEFALLGG